MNDSGSIALGFRVDGVDWGRREDGTTVCLRGRWRRRPFGTVQPMLVVEHAGSRRRFPARPEPPGLSAVAPGESQLIFDLPSDATPGPEDRVWLGLGAVMVSLPGPEDPAVPPPAREAQPRAGTARDPSERAERMALEAELAVLRAALAAAEAEPGEELRSQLGALQAERDELRGRLETTEAALAAARAQPPSAPAPPAGVPARLGEVLDALGEEFGALRGALERERAARIDAQARAAAAEAELTASRQRATEAYSAIDRLRAAISPGPAGSPAEREPPSPRPSTPAPATGSEGSGLDPGRFDAARSRLRTVPLDETPASDWLGRALRSLAADDPAAAGALVLALLPAQATYATVPVRYDLVLADGGALLVDVPGERRPVSVRAAEGPRAPGEADFTFRGTLAALGRLVAEGRAPVRLSPRRRRGRLSGERAAAAVLTELGRRRITLRGLLAAGAALDGALALELAARAIDPALTRGETVTLAFGPPAGEAGARLLFRVRDGARPLVLRAPLSAPAAVEVDVAERDVAAVLAGDPRVAATIQGDPAPLERLRAWLVSAQSG